MNRNGERNSIGFRINCVKCKDKRFDPLWSQPKIKDLKRAIEQLHNCHASHIEDVMVLEHFGLDSVWEGRVSIFALKGHSQTDKCYAWSSPIEGSTKRRYYAVLHIPPVDSPEKAVRASIVQDHKTGKIK